MPKKVMAVLAVGADANKEKNCGHAISHFKDTADFINMKWAGSVSASAEAHGSIAQNSEALQEAYELGKKAVSLATK